MLAENTLVKRAQEMESMRVKLEKKMIEEERMGPLVKAAFEK